MTIRLSVLILLVCVLVTGACGPDPEPPADREVTMRRLAFRIAADDDGGAIDDLRTYLDRVPDDPTMRYNLACFLARRGEPELAFDELELALRHGYRHLDRIRQDQDLAALRSDDRLEVMLIAHADSLNALAEAATIDVSGDRWSEPRLLQGGGSVRVRVTAEALEVSGELLPTIEQGHLVVAVPVDLEAHETHRWFEFQLGGDNPDLSIDDDALLVPWSSLVPHQPPLDLRLGLNLRFETSRGHHALVPDPLASEPGYPWRRYAPLVIDPGDRPMPLLAARPATRLAVGDSVSVEVAVQGQPDGEVPVTMRVDGRDAATLAVPSEFGLGYGTMLLSLGLDAPGWATLTATAGDLTWSGRVYRLPGDWFLTHNAALDDVPEVERDIVRYWLFKVLRGQQSMDPHDDPAPLAEAVRHTEELLARHAATGSVVPDSATVLTVAIHTNQESLQEASLALPPADRRSRARAATLVLVNDTPTAVRVAAALHQANPTRIWLVAAAAPIPGNDGAVVAQVHRTLQWLRQLLPSLERVALVGAGRGATSAVLAAQASPTAWASLSLWADWTLDPWPLAADQDLATTAPPGLATLSPRVSLPEAPMTGRVATVATALGGTVERRPPEAELADWLTDR